MDARPAADGSASPNAAAVGGDRARAAAAVTDPETLAALSATLESRTAEQRIEWALANLPGPFVLASSFGAQAAVALHLVTQIAPRTPVVLVDTLYHFPQTLQFARQLAARLDLDLRIYRAPLTAAQFEARHGRLWEQGVDGLARYHEIVKLEPFRRSLAELGARSWFAGLRRAQSSTRRALPVLQRLDGRFKVHPLVDWTDRDVGLYLKRHGLPWHPLRDRGYVSIGDWHSTRTLADAGDEQSTRFGGLKRECGLHGIEG